MKIHRILKNASPRLYHFMIRERLSPAVEAQQRLLYHYYHDRALEGKLPGIENTGLRVFSQFEEDGKLLYILALIGMKTRRFIEIGADDGLNSNCANLYFHFGFHGLFIDGNRRSIMRGKKFYARYPNPWCFKPVFRHAMVTRENINEIIEQEGFQGEIDLLSIDIDGNDYWIWDALQASTPGIVIIETHVEFGLRNIVVPYDPGYVYPGKHPLYHGASSIAMINLAKRKGYRLVGANDYGSNFIFVREELCGNLLPEKTAGEVLQHPSALQSFSRFDEIKDMEFLQG